MRELTRILVRTIDAPPIRYFASFSKRVPGLDVFNSHENPWRQDCFAVLGVGNIISDIGTDVEQLLSDWIS